MGWPIIEGTEYIGIPCAWWMGGTYTPYLLLAAFSGILPAEEAIGEDYAAPNGTYVLQQESGLGCVWVWEDSEPIAGPSDVYGCETFPGIEARKVTFLLGEFSWEVQLTATKSYFGFIRNDTNDGVYCGANQNTYNGNYWWGGSCVIMAIQPVSVGFSLLSFASLLGISDIDKFRAEIYAVDNEKACVRFSRKIDNSRFYVRKEG